MPGTAPREDYRKSPLVSIVTPSFNQGRFIRQTIESVLAQDYSALEYWVIDGGSTDETLEILRAYELDPRFRWLSEPDHGQADAINKGWQRCEGDIVAWLNSDDLYRPNAISTAVQTLLRRPQTGLVCGSASVIDEVGNSIGRIPAPHLSLQEMLQMREYLPQPAVFLRSSIVKQIGGLNPYLHYAMDFDLFLRMATVAEIRYIDDYLADYRLHHVSKTSTDLFKLRLEAARVARKFLATCPKQCLSSLEKRQCLSYAYLVEAYANIRLGTKRDVISNTVKGLLIYPLNVRWIFRRILNHINESPINKTSP